MKQPRIEADEVVAFHESPSQVLHSLPVKRGIKREREDVMYTMSYSDAMSTLSRSISTRALRDELSDVVGRVAYGGERVGVTRHGKLAAVVISTDDLELLEALEDARDAADLHDARAADDGGRVSLDELRRELDA